MSGASAPGRFALNPRPKGAVLAPMLREKIKQCAPSHLWTKFFGHTLAIASFFIAYFWVAAHPLFPVTEIPATAVDRWVPLWPWTVWIYFSLWVYICLPATLMRTRRLLWQYFLGAFWIAVIGIGIFIVWPSSTPQWTPDWAAYPGSLTFMKNEELSRNACPSLHVSYAVFTVFWLEWLLRRVNAGRAWRAGNLLWALAIIVATLTTKQHVFLDVIAGAVFGGLIFAINIVWVRRTESLA